MTDKAAAKLAESFAEVGALVDPATTELVRSAIAWRVSLWTRGPGNPEKTARDLILAIDALVEMSNDDFEVVENTSLASKVCNEGHLHMAVLDDEDNAIAIVVMEYEEAKEFAMSVILRLEQWRDDEKPTSESPHVPH